MCDLKIIPSLAMGLPMAPNVVPLAPVGTTPIINFLSPHSATPIASGNSYIEKKS